MSADSKELGKRQGTQAQNATVRLGDVLNTIRLTATGLEGIVGDMADSAARSDGLATEESLWLIGRNLAHMADLAQEAMGLAETIMTGR